MSSPVSAPSPNPALCRGTGIEYQAYQRRFQPDVDASVLILIATCCYNPRITVSFRPTDSGYELVEQPPAGVFRNMVSYYVASWTTGLESDATPAHVTISDSYGQHLIDVKEWQASSTPQPAAATPIQRLSLPGQAALQAEFIVNNVQQTDYQHTLSIDVDRGIYKCDCNGFASFVLERAAPDHYALIPKEADQPRPRAFEYYDFFNSLTPQINGGWHRIDFLRDARRGDMIAWRFPKIEKHHDTGHVVFAAETPTVDGPSTFSVRVYDSAAEPHFNDTRGASEEEFATGVGSGIIKFKVDDQGRPIAFQFAPSDKFESLPISIGRLESFPDETV